MSGLLNEAIFFIVIIALLLIAFILGLIVGRIFYRQNKSQARNTNTLSNENMQTANSSEQLGNQTQNTVPLRNYTQYDPRCKYFYYWYW